MEPLYYVMAILGCGDAQTTCQEARVEPVRYESVASCQAAMGDTLVRHTDLSFPTITAACQSNTERMARADRNARQG